jgi:hypothetical protein
MKTFLLFLFLIFFGQDISGQNIVPMTNWIPSDGTGVAQYGKGLFWYRVFRTTTIDNTNQYSFYIYFISNSYYSIYNGIQPYRVKTLIPSAYFTVNGKPVRNELFGEVNFWIIFLGNIDTGEGFLGAIIKSPSPSINIINFYWEPPQPY